jgi:hypothetical protein
MKGMMYGCAIADTCPRTSIPPGDENAVVSIEYPVDVVVLLPYVDAQEVNDSTTTSDARVVINFTLLFYHGCQYQV